MILFYGPFDIALVDNIPPPSVGAPLYALNFYLDAEFDPFIVSKSPRVPQLPLEVLQPSCCFVSSISALARVPVNSSSHRADLVHE